MKKNTKKSYAWSGFSKIGLQLVRLSGFCQEWHGCKKTA